MAGQDIRYWLTVLYRADVLSQGPWEKLLTKAKQALTNDPALRAAAEAQLTELREVNKKRQSRDHITQKQVSYLQEMLA